MNMPLRQFASPYARKLAGQRGIALVDLRGSGPAGRIVAADVLTFVKPPVATEEQLPSSPPTMIQAAVPTTLIAAIATQLDLGNLRELLQQFGKAQLTLSTEALFIRAAARGLARLELNGSVGWEAGSGSDKREIIITGADKAALGVILNRLDDPALLPGDQENPLLSIRHFASSGIQAVAMPLLQNHKMRLVISASSPGAADCLLCFDAAGVGEDDAVGFLAAFKDDLETPLRLLA